MRRDEREMRIKTTARSNYRLSNHIYQVKEFELYLKIKNLLKLFQKFKTTTVELALSSSFNWNNRIYQLTHLISGLQKHPIFMLRFLPRRREYQVASPLFLQPRSWNEHTQIWLHQAQPTSAKISQTSAPLDPWTRKIIHVVTSS